MRCLGSAFSASNTRSRCLCPISLAGLRQAFPIVFPGSAFGSPPRGLDVFPCNAFCSPPRSLDAFPGTLFCRRPLSLGVRPGTVHIPPRWAADDRFARYRWFEAAIRSGCLARHLAWEARRFASFARRSVSRRRRRRGGHSLRRSSTLSSSLSR